MKVNKAVDAKQRPPSTQVKVDIIKSEMKTSSKATKSEVRQTIPYSPCIAKIKMIKSIPISLPYNEYIYASYMKYFVRIQMQI